MNANKIIGVLNILYWVYNFVIWGILVPYKIWDTFKTDFLLVHPIFKIFSVLVILVIYMIFLLIIYSLAAGITPTFKIIGAIYGILIIIFNLCTSESYYNILIHTVPIIYYFQRRKNDHSD